MSSHHSTVGRPMESVTTLKYKRLRIGPGQFKLPG